MAYGDFKDLKRRTASDKILRDKAFHIAKNAKNDGYQRGLASMVYKFFDKKPTGGGVNVPLEFNEQLPKELHKPIIRKVKKRKVYSEYKDNIWGANLADMQLISKFNKGFRFLLCFIDVFSKYAWVVPLKDKKGVSIVDAFQKILDKSGRKPSKIWVDKGSEFYNSSFKNFLKDNDIEMYSIRNEGKSVVIERFIRTLKNKIYKYMTAIFILINYMIYNNKYHRTIKMKPVDVKDNTYIYFEKDVNDKNAKFKVGNHVRISKHKNIFTKGRKPNWSEEIFIISKIKNSMYQFHGHM